MRQKQNTLPTRNDENIFVAICLCGQLEVRNSTMKHELHSTIMKM